MNCINNGNFLLQTISLPEGISCQKRVRSCKKNLDQKQGPAIRVQWMVGLSTFLKHICQYTEYTQLLYFITSHCIISHLVGGLEHF